MQNFRPHTSFPRVQGADARASVSVRRMGVPSAGSATRRPAASSDPQALEAKGSFVSGYVYAATISAFMWAGIAAACTVVM